MLSGIKLGKKKKTKQQTEEADKPAASSPSTTQLKEPPPSSSASSSSAAASSILLSSVDKSKFKSNSKSTDNQSIAEQLRQSLASGDTSALEASSSSSPLDALERRGRIAGGTAKSHAYSSTSTIDNPDVVVLNAQGVGVAAASNKAEEDMTIRELVARERHDTGMTLDEQMTRNLARVGKKRRRKIGKDDDSDEEVERMKKLLPNQPLKPKPKAVAKSQQRDVHRQIAQHHQQEKITSKCAWWLESSTFSKHRLLALGNHVSLVMAPPNASLQPGLHFYLVPIKHADSFVDCGSDDHAIWDEVRRFQTSLSNLFARDKMGIVLCETVLPNKGFWQTKLQVIPVPFDVLADAPIYFKSSMLEQIEEWGTHNKILSTTSVKPLTSVIPKNFPYFYVEWGNVATSANTGYAQIIESADFSPDFGLDTLAGMMELDPIRLQRKHHHFSLDQERQGIADFLAKWKAFDWTLALDEQP
jgi:hypothetical protein